MSVEYTSETLRAFFADRDTRTPARVWANEALLHDLAKFGITFFEGDGTNPTGLSGYATSKLWLRVSAGVTTVPGEIRCYDGSGDATLLASWPLLDAAGLRRHLSLYSKADSDARFVRTVNGSGPDGSGNVVVSPGAGSSPTTTRGDLIRRGAAADERVAIGTSGYALISDGTDPAWTGFLQAGTGAATRTWQAKARERVSVDDFGAVGDGTTVDTTAFTNALNSLGATGGTVWLNMAKTYRIGSITIPTNVRLSGHVIGLDSTSDNITFNFDDMGSTLLLASGATITLSTGAAITNCVIRPYGLSISQTSSSAWAGDAITIGSTGYGAAVVNNIILGFNRGVFSNGASRVRVEWNAIDCNTGIDVRATYDSTRILNNHCWPYLTSGAFWTSGADYASRDKTMLYRTGTGLYVAEGTDDTHIDGNLFYGFLAGIRCYNAGALNFGRNWIDHPYGVNRSSNYGLLTEGTVDNMVAQTFFIWGTKYGLFGNSLGTVSIDLVHAEKIDTDAAYLNSGNFRIGHLAAHDVGSRAITIVHATNVTLDLDGYDFREVDASEAVSLPANASTEYIRIGDGKSDEVDGIALIGTNNLLFPEIASGSTMNLPAHGTWFTVTGTANIVNIAGGWGGRRIVLRCAGASSLAASGGNVTLDRSFQAAAGSTIELYYDGHSSTWRELGRSTGIVRLDASGNAIFPANAYFPNTGLWINDTNATHNLNIKPGSDLTANRTLTLTTGDADRDINVAALVGAWTSYTPTVTADSGSLTAYTASGKYRTIGKTTNWNVNINISNNGTAAVALIVTLPNVSTNITVLGGKGVGGAFCTATAGAGGGSVYVVTSSNAYPGGTGVDLYLSGTYENN